MRLALPLSAGHAGTQLMTIVDTAIVGRLGAAALGGSGIGGSLWFTVSCLGLGIVLGAETLVAQATGAREPRQARGVFWQTLWVAGLIGVPLTGVLALLPLLFGLLGLEKQTAHEAARCLYGRLPQVIPFLVFSACRSYLQGRGITRPVVWAMVLANLLNLGFNLLLIFGDGGLVRVGLPAIGLPPLGVLGSGLSTSLAQIGSCLLLIYCVRKLWAEERGRAEAPTAREAILLRRFDGATIRRIFLLGTPIALQILAEIGAFAIGALLAGRLGAVSSAAHQLALTLASLTFTVTLGVGSATAVRVGQHVGAGDSARARRAGLVALLVSCAFMSLSALTFLTAGYQLASLLTGDAVVRAAAVPLIQIAGVFQLFDGAQVTAAGALRGAGDTRMPFIGNAVGYYAVGLPLAVFLIYQVRLGVAGIWWGLTVGLAIVAVWLSARFLHISSRRIERA